MTPSPWSTHRQPRRLGLWAPWAFAAALSIAWCAAWFVARDRVAHGLEAVRASAEFKGFVCDWKRERISGFPFRLDVDLDDVRVREPSGWGVSAPKLKAEAFVFSPTHWIAVAPSGATIQRRRGGALMVNAKALRASLSAATANPPRLSIEGLDLTFTAPASARPFPLEAATEFHFHTKAGPEDQGAAYLEIDGAKTHLPGLIGRIAEGRPASLIADGIFTRAHALTGPGWPAAMRAWSAANGKLTVRRLRVTAGSAELDSRAGTLSIGGDGRVRGEVDLALREAPRTLDALGTEGTISPDTARSAITVVGAVQHGPIATLPLRFEAGRATLGPVALGPAPRIY